MNDFQERLSELLEDNNMSRLQLAKNIGISPSTINGYFNQEYYPQIEIAVRISDYFRCGLDYLFGFTDVMKKKTYKNILENFNKNLDNLLKQNKLSVAKVTSDIQMSEYNYYRWKSGMLPKTINLLQVAKYFGVTLDYLLCKNIK